MANKPLASIKFPDLPDTYSVPQIDDTFAVAGKVPDAKKTGNKFNAVNNSVSYTVTHTNLFNKATATVGKGLDNHGDVIDYQESFVSDYIPVIAGKTLYSSSLGVAKNFTSICEYDAQKVFNGEYASAVSSYTLSNDCAYVRIARYSTTPTTYMNDYQVEYDGVTDYKPYKTLGATQLDVLANAGDTAVLQSLCNEIVNGINVVWNDDYALTTAGTAVAVSDYSASDFIPITDVVKNASFDNLRQKLSSTVAPICFYDKDKAFINYYSVETNGGNKPNNVAIHVNMKGILSSFTGAEYIRIGKKTTDVVTVHANTLQDPSYKMAMFRKAIFVGDSVTAGFVVEGTQEHPAITSEGSTQTTNPNAIYKVMATFSPPSQFGRAFAGIDITNSSQSGISVNEYYSTLYSNVDFSEYDLIVIELGYNAGTGGYLNLANLAQEGTNAYNYNVMAQAIRTQNSEAVIALVRSSDSANTGNWPPVLYQIAQNCNGIVIDLVDNAYLDLQDSKYHGYYKSGNNDPALDNAHFTRVGYNAKAHVLARLIADKVFN